MRFASLVAVLALWLASADVAAQPGNRVTISANADGSQVFVRFGGARGNGDDWVSLAPADSPPTEYTTYQYAATRDGALTFSGVQPGRTVARIYFGSSSYVIRGQSAPFVVAEDPGTACGRAGAGATSLAASADGTTAVVRYSGFCGAAQDWVAIAAVDSAPSDYVQWVYTGGARSGVLSLEGLPAGRYVARAFFDWAGTQSYTVRAQSDPFWVAPPGCVCGDALVAR